MKTSEATTNSKAVSSVRLNYNELPFAPQREILKIAQEYCAYTNRYPEVDTALLRQALAELYEVPIEWIVAGAGSAVVIHQAMIASGQGEIAFAWPSFDAFPYMAAGLGMPVRLTATRDGACDLDDLLQAVTPQTSMVIICTPNSPTGGVIHHDALVDFLKAAPAHLTVLIDEAYYEFARDPDLPRSLELVRTYPNVVFSRTFSKAHGLAGLRVGYAVAQPLLAEKIRQAGVPFAVPVPAQMAALAALRHPRSTERRIAAILRERQRVTEALKQVGTEVVVGHGNFVWLPVGESAAAVAALLMRSGVAVKVHPGLGVRVTIGTQPENTIFLQVWSDNLVAIRKLLDSHHPGI